MKKSMKSQSVNSVNSTLKEKQAMKKSTKSQPDISQAMTRASLLFDRIAQLDRDIEILRRSIARDSN